MEKDAAGYPSLPLHYGLMNPGTSRTSPAAYPTSRAVLRGGGGGDVTSLPDPWGSNPLGPPGPELRIFTSLLAQFTMSTCGAHLHPRCPGQE